MAATRNLPSGHTVEPMDQEDNRRHHLKFPFVGDMVRVEPGHVVLMEETIPILEKMYKFQFRPTDVVVMSFPKSGTTWLQEIVWTILNNPDGNNPKASSSIDTRSPQFELDTFFLPKNSPKIDISDDELFQYVKQKAEEFGHPDLILFTLALLANDPRVLKTHLPISLFNKAALDVAKFVYIARDPRDVIVSRYHFMQLFKAMSFTGTLDEFVELFVNDEVFYGSYWTNVEEAFALRHHPNFLFVYYEDLKENPVEQVTKISDFLGANRTQEQIKKIVDHTSFKNMKTRAAKVEDNSANRDTYFDTDIKEKKGGFYRKGETGDWKRSFTSEQVKKIESWIMKHNDSFEKIFGTPSK